jgi:hypothetical protein
VTLKTGDEYVIHPSNIIAYSMMQNSPQPYRFKASSFRLQIPNPLTWLPDTRFWRTMRESAIWTFMRDAAFVIRTWARRTIWGDRVSHIIPRKEAAVLSFSAAVLTLSRTGHDTCSISWCSTERCFDDQRCQRNCRQSCWLSNQSSIITSRGWRQYATNSGAFTSNRHIRERDARWLSQI